MCLDFGIGGGEMAKTGTVTIYGIKNCDTMKKARTWLEANGVAYAFHDYKAQGIESSTLERWARELGWEALLNRAGTTFRKLSETDKAGINQEKAIALMRSQPSLIKRPVLDTGRNLIAGFDRAAYATAFR
jgi:arsenate reductase (glutaredoxin)